MCARRRGAHADGCPSETFAASTLGRYIQLGDIVPLTSTVTSDRSKIDSVVLLEDVADFIHRAVTGLSSAMTVTGSTVFALPHHFALDMVFGIWRLDDSEVVKHCGRVTRNRIFGTFPVKSSYSIFSGRGYSWRVMSVSDCYSGYLRGVETMLDYI